MTQLLSGGGWVGQGHCNAVLLESVKVKDRISDLLKEGNKEKKCDKGNKDKSQLSYCNRE